MSKETEHPGFHLEKLLNEKNINQKELSSKTDIAPSFINNLLNGSKSISVNIAFALEAADLGDALEWLTLQAKWNLYEASIKEETKEKNQRLKAWNDLIKVVPLNFFKKFDFLKIKNSNDVNKVYDIYGAKSLEDLSNIIDNTKPQYFRKSNAFAENPYNVMGWSMLSKFLVKEQNLNKFDAIACKDDLIDELKECLYKNRNTIQETKKILNHYGIKFITLNRPSKTPVEGLSFISGDNPTIALSLKYDRLDNFAYNLFHELGHVFCHLTKVKNQSTFFINSDLTPNSDKKEIEADEFANDYLIDEDLWLKFYYTQIDNFNDSNIMRFAEDNRIHPGIIRGRICNMDKSYYKKRSAINSINKIDRQFIY